MDKHIQNLEEAVSMYASVGTDQSYTDVLDAIRECFVAKSNILVPYRSAEKEGAITPGVTPGPDGRYYLMVFTDQDKALKSNEITIMELPLFDAVHFVSSMVRDPALGGMVINFGSTTECFVRKGDCCFIRNQCDIFLRTKIIRTPVKQ